MGPRLCKFALITCALVFAVHALAGRALAQPAPQAPLTNENAPHRIADRYIVVFKTGTPRAAVQSAEDTVKKLGGTILFTYTAALTGFNATIPAAALPAVRAIAGIDYIEADQMMTTKTIQPPNPPSTPSFGLDRIDRRLLPLDGKYTYSETGMGVNAYVIDSGIYVGHTDFGSRAHWAVDYSGVMPANTDCNGHGTHVAGVIGGTNYGVAKNVTLYAVRVTDCNGGAPLGTVTQGVEWVITNAVKPAVANISLGGDSSNTGSGTLTTAVENLVSAGVTVVVAAGNDASDACGETPANASNAITVGSVDPTDDTQDPNSNYGTCLKLFAPGVNIVSAFPDILLPATSSCTVVSTTPHSQSTQCSGTSEAAPHVAGVAARYLQTHTTATPAEVWAAIHAADDVSTTASWPGIVGINLPPFQSGSPNELLHWGSRDNGLLDGDPHLTTVDGIKYDFQGAGEYVALRDGNGLEIQTRHTPVPTAPPAASAYTRLATCVSVTTAIAARVGTHRVSYERNSDDKTLELRVDGAPAKLPAAGLNLGPGARVIASTAASGVIEIDFPDGTNLTITPQFWQSQNTPYLNISVFNTTASEGLMGTLAKDSWLPALPNGTSVGTLPTPMPGASHQRFVELYQKFGDAWRVTSATTLFDYAPGTSTATFTNPGWPPEKEVCDVPDKTAPKPLDPKEALRLCSGITDANRKANCVFDTTITAESSFAKTYLISQRIETDGTTTTVNDNKDPTQPGEAVTFTATVKLTASGKAVTTGTAQFTLDGANVGTPIKLNAKGQAVWQSSSLAVGNRQVQAVYTPASGTTLLASRSLDRTHTVAK